MQLSIGTWNLDRSGVRNTSRWLHQQAEMLKRQCDLWILTEAHRGQVLAPGLHSVYSAQGSGIYQPEECAVALWSRWPLLPTNVSDSRLSACALIRSTDATPPVLVYGTLIPYADDGVSTSEATRWQRHREAADAMLADIALLRSQHPEAEIVVGGDFNMNFDGSHWYGLNEVKRKILTGMEALGMVCHTTRDIRKDCGIPRASVDHIWTSSNVRLHEPPVFWMKDTSDHNGVAIRVVS